jgi:glutamate---methylamine ligase
LDAAAPEDTAFLDSYLKLKHEDWNAFMSQPMPWERATTLDC